MWERVLTIDEAANVTDIDNMDILTGSVIERTKVGQSARVDWESYIDSITDDTVRHKYETFLRDGLTASPLERAQITAQLFKSAYSLLLFPWE